MHSTAGLSGHDGEDKNPNPATIFMYEWLILLCHIQEVLGLNRGLEISYHD
jgi:hypothetical protein